MRVALASVIVVYLISFSALGGDTNPTMPIPTNGIISFDFQQSDLFANPISLPDNQLLSQKTIQNWTFLVGDSEARFDFGVRRCTPENYQPANYPTAVPICTGIENVQGATYLNSRFPVISAYGLHLGVYIPEANIREIAALAHPDYYPPRSIEITLEAKNGVPPNCTTNVGEVLPASILDPGEMIIRYIAPVNLRSGGFQEIQIGCSTPLDYVSVDSVTPNLYTAGSIFYDYNYLIFGYANFYTSGLSTATGLKLQIEPLDRDEVELPVQARQVDISNNVTVTLPLGQLADLTLQNSSGEVIPATFTLSAPTFDQTLVSAESLYTDHVGILFQNTTRDNVIPQEIIALHLGTESLTITPTDTTIPPITVKLKVVAGSLGSTNNQFDSSINNYASLRGIPPQFIKALISHESGKTFATNSYRYEPVSIDAQYLGADISDKTRTKFSNVIISDINAVVLSSKSTIAPRSIYGIRFPKEQKDGFITNDFEAKEGINIFASDILDYNDTSKYGFASQNWLKVASKNLKDFNKNRALGNGTSSQAGSNDFSKTYGFPAQTVAAASYGLMHVVHFYAVTQWTTKLIDGSGLAIDPTDAQNGLVNSDVNIKFGSLALRSAFGSVNSTDQIQNFKTFSKYSDLLRKASQKYNGINSKFTADRILAEPYNQAVWGYWNNYLPQ